jgi:hypothetical protein
LNYLGVLCAGDSEDDWEQWEKEWEDFLFNDDWLDDEYSYDDQYDDSTNLDNENNDVDEWDYDADWNDWYYDPWVDCTAISVGNDNSTHQNIILNGK